MLLLQTKSADLHCLLCNNFFLRIPLHLLSLYICMNEMNFFEEGPYKNELHLFVFLLLSSLEIYLLNNFKCLSVKRPFLQQTENVKLRCIHASLLFTPKLFFYMKHTINVQSQKISKNTCEGECVFVDSNVSGMHIYKNGNPIRVFFQRFAVANEWNDLYEIDLKR